MGKLRNYFLNHYPRTDFHELNQDWMISMLYDMINQVENFVEMNSVKYADPIQWDITHQYEKNTIVVDAITGTAYISSKPVPMGVALSRTEYWSVIFDLGRFITLASQNFANSYEAVLTTTATMPTDKDKWVVWNSILYRAKNDIHVGDRYVIDGNIEKYTVEMFFDELAHLIAEADTALHGEIVDESVVRENADTALQDNIDSEATARENADTSLGSRIDNEIHDRENADTSLGSRIDGEIHDREDADTSLGSRIDNEIHDRENAYAIITTRLNNATVKNAKDYGAIGDGVTNDTTALQDWLNDLSSGDVGYLPTGDYITSSTLNVPNVDNITIIGTPTSTIVSSFASGDIIVCGGTVRHSNLNIENIRIISNITRTSGAGIHIIGYKNKSLLKNITIGDYGSGSNTMYDGIIFEHTNVTYLNMFNIYCAHDGILIHGGVGNTRPDSSDLFVDNGFVIGANNNIHVAGGFGGLYLNNTLVFGGGNGFCLDNSICTQSNREIMISNTCCFDGANHALMLLNETIGSGVFVNCSAFFSGAGYYAPSEQQQYASNIKIQSFPYGTLNLSSSTIKGSTGNGIWINDTTSKVFISESVEIAYNAVGVNNFNNSTYLYCHGILHDNTTHDFYGTYSPSITPYTGA